MEKKEALPGDAPICTIFYAGLGGCVADLAPYQKAGIMVHSGDTIRSLTRSLPDDACLPPIWTSPVADAIEPYDLLTTASLGLKPSWLPARLLSCCYAWHRKRKHKTVHSYPTAITPLYPVRFNCAQASDVAHALGYTKRTLADMIKLGKRAVMFGRSRGSLVALHVFLCLNDEERKHVAFLLLEGAFYDSRSVSRSRYGTGVASWITWILPWISEWRPTGYDIFRHELRTLRDNKVPIAIVTSMADQVVPVENANELYEVLRGYQQRAPLGFLTLTHSSHDGYAYEHDDDRDAYAKLLRELMASHSGSRGRTNV